MIADPLDEGIRAFRAQDWIRAEQLFLRATAERPRDAAAHKWLGMTYAARDRLSQAVDPFSRACELNPREPDSCYYLGRALLGLARFEEAEKALRKALATGGTRAWGALALVYSNTGRRAEAEKAFQAAIAAGDQNARQDYERFRRENAAAPAAGNSGPIRFEPRDLSFTLRNGATGLHRLPETMPGGLAVFDYDNDGWDDLFFTTMYGSNALLRNSHDGSFVDVTEAAGLKLADPLSMGAVAADFDNDGFTDLFVTGLRGRVRLYRNRGSGEFEDVTARSGIREGALWSVSAAWLDYDRDGLLDLFVVRYVEWDGTREPDCVQNGIRQYCHPRHFAPLPNALYRNMGGGRFTDVSEAAGIAKHRGKGMGVAVADYDRDGWPDIFVANDSEPNFLFRNREGKRFEEVALQAGVALNESGNAVSSMGAEFRDFDNDGLDDLFVTALSNETFPMFRNLGGGRFEDATLRLGLASPTMPWTGWSAALADFDNDGWRDLAIAGGHVQDNAEAFSGRASRHPNLFLRNQGGKRFTGEELPGGRAFHRGLVASDLDHDGRLDLVVTRLNEPSRVLWNRTEAAGSWLEIDLVGSAVGARVEIENSQSATVSSASGYASSGPRTLHFGLGPRREPVGLIRILWPAGHVQELRDVPLNQRISIRQRKN